MKPAIRVEGLGKRYKLGLVHTDLLSEKLGNGLRAIGNRLRGSGGVSRARAAKAEKDYFWALKDITFEVQPGEVMGVIGRNGAGKSTLLKILSRITSPTTGQIHLQGRVASLLEVGTGFHPELTGRENIFLNGAILGMTREEINSKFDEIVAFAEVEKFIDTPVKRYSSGMHVRLAFAVAAHLEPDILVVDEVLAVGDAEFQKKCIGKMQNVASKGRTVLFVSHNMASISNLCTRGLVLQDGEVLMTGDIASAVSTYIEDGRQINSHLEFNDVDTAPGDHVAKLKSVSVLNGSGNPVKAIDIREPMILQMEYWDLEPRACPTAIFHFKDELGNTLFATNEFSAEEWKRVHAGEGLITARCHIPGNFFAEGHIFVLAAVNTYNPSEIHALIDDAVSFEVVDHSSGDGVRGPYVGPWPGLLRPWMHWETRSD